MYLPSPEIRVVGEALSAREYKAVGNVQGQFTVGRVEPGVYTLTVSVRGFKKAVKSIQVASGQQLDTGITRLQIGGCNEPGVICDDFGLTLYNAPIHAQGSLEVPQLCAVDIDEGKVTCTIELDGRATIPPAKDADSDFWLKIGGRGEVKFSPRNGVTLALNPATESSRDGCASAAYSSADVRVDGLPLGSRICLRTTRGRYAQVEFSGVIRLRAKRVKIEFVTWQGKVDIPPLQLSPHK